MTDQDQRSGAPSPAGARTAAVLAVAAVVLMMVVSCGGRPPAVVAPPTPVAEHAWSLDAVVDDTGADAEVYRAVRSSCDAGQQALAARWTQLTSPREVVLFAAAIQMCRQDRAGAAGRYYQARETYGWSGLGPDQDAARCAAYRALTAVIEHANGTSVMCPDGPGPAFVRSPCGVVDDPLTPENEATAPQALSCRPSAPPTTDPTTTRPTIRPTTPPTVPPPPTVTRPTPRPAPPVTKCPSGMEDDCTRKPPPDMENGSGTEKSPVTMSS